MIRKISGKNKSPSYTHLNMVGTDSKATSKTDIADTLGETFCHNSSSFKYSESFRKIKTEQEKVKLNFKSQNNEIYNKDFNLDELVEAIQLSHDSATGPDEIHYQMLKQLNMKFQFAHKRYIVKIKVFSCFKAHRCCIDPAENV